MPFSYRPSSLTLLNSPTKFQGGGKRKRWEEGRQILGNLWRKKKKRSNNVTPQQPSSTFKWLFVFGNALDKPQSSRRALPPASYSSPGPHSTLCAPGTDTTLATGYSHTNPHRAFEAAFHSHSHQPSTLTKNSNN